MPRLPVHSVESAPEASRDALKALEANVALHRHRQRTSDPPVTAAA